MSHTAVAVMGDRDHVCVCLVQGSSQQAVRVSLSWSCYIIVDAAVAPGNGMAKHRSMEGEGSQETGKLKKQGLEQVVLTIPEEGAILKTHCALQTWTDPRPVDTREVGKSKEEA